MSYERVHGRGARITYPHDESHEVPRHYRNSANFAWDCPYCDEVRGAGLEEAHNHLNDHHYNKEQESNG